MFTICFECKHCDGARSLICFYGNRSKDMNARRVNRAPLKSIKWGEEPVENVRRRVQRKHRRPFLEPRAEQARLLCLGVETCPKEAPAA